MENKNSPATGSEKSIKVLVSIAPRPPCSSSSEYVMLQLYMHDRQLAGAPAALVAETLCTFEEDFASPQQVVLEPNLDTAKQNGKSWDEMASPSLYVSIDATKSSLTYTGGPVFNVQPGSEVAFTLKPKSS